MPPSELSRRQSISERKLRDRLRGIFRLIKDLMDILFGENSFIIIILEMVFYPLFISIFNQALFNIEILLSISPLIVFAVALGWGLNYIYVKKGYLFKLTYIRYIMFYIFFMIFLILIITEIKDNFLNNINITLSISMKLLFFILYYILYILLILTIFIPFMLYFYLYYKYYYIIKNKESKNHFNYFLLNFYIYMFFIMLFVLVYINLNLIGMGGSCKAWHVAASFPGSKGLDVFISNLTGNASVLNGLVTFRYGGRSILRKNVTFIKEGSVLGERFVSRNFSVVFQDYVNCNISGVFVKSGNFVGVYRVLKCSPLGVDIWRDKWRVILQLALYRDLDKKIVDLEWLKSSYISLDILYVLVFALIVFSFDIKDDTMRVYREVLASVAITLAVGGVGFVALPSGLGYFLSKMIMRYIFIKYLLISLPVLVISVLIFLVDNERNANIIKWVISVLWFAMFLVYAIYVYIEIHIRTEVLENRVFRVECFNFIFHFLEWIFNPYIDDIVIIVSVILLFYILYKYYDILVGREENPRYFY